MEGQLRYSFVLSLKEVVLRRVAINLWNEPDVLASIETFSPAFLELHCQYSKTWRETVESKVRDKLSKLKLPKSLKEQLLHIITPIGLQIKKWKGFHEQFLDMPLWKEILEKYLLDPNVTFGAPILAKLCWTTAGAVDYRKTAEELVRHEMVDILQRYQLASMYCLDDCTLIFWEELPEEIKREFYNGSKSRSMNTRPDFQFCKSYILKGEQSGLDRTIGKYYNAYTAFHHHAFQYWVSRDNKAANEYFFRRLTQVQKEASLITGTVTAIVHRFSLAADSFPLENLSSVLCYLISQMNNEQRMRIFKEHPSNVLLFFMDWPYQDIFLKNAHLLWDFLPAGDYDNLLRKMSDYFSESNGYFAKFFREFFIHSPAEFKKRFVDQECQRSYFFPEIFSIEDSETIQVIFRNADAADRLRLVSSMSIFILFYYCIFRDRVHMVEVCIREATLSKEDSNRLMDAFVEFLTSQSQKILTIHSKKNLTIKIYNHRLIKNRFRRLMYKIGASTQVKRCLEDETLNKAKNLRSDV